MTQKATQFTNILSYQAIYRFVFDKADAWVPIAKERRLHVQINGYGPPSIRAFPPRGLEGPKSLQIGD